MTDQSIIKLCQQGDAEAFEVLVTKYYDTIYCFAYRWCQDKPNSEDITQLCCMKLAQSISSYSFRSSFTSWLFRLVINCAKDFYKSPNQHNTREINDDKGLYAAVVPDDSQQRLYRQQMLEAIDDLPNDLKEPLLLVYVSGLTHKQAADKLDVKEGTVSWKVYEARKLLKQKFSSAVNTTTTTVTPTKNDDATGGLL